MSISSDGILKIGPQPGLQTKFAQCPADIMIAGGTAGCGKTWSLTFEAARNCGVRGYNGILFRRLSTEIRGGGGIWEESNEIYQYIQGAKPREHFLDWRFESGAKIQFSHLQHEKDVKSHQSKQYAFIGFDQIEQFTALQFWYLLSRNRSVCGVRPYVRATCNPVSEGWLRELVDWYIGKGGFPNPRRAGKIRYFVRVNDDLVWSNSKRELKRRFRKLPVKSFCFIPGKLSENKILTAKDPDYYGNLMALPRVEREALAFGNWNVKPHRGIYFNRGTWEVIDVAPFDWIKRTRSWDRAASEPSTRYPDPDWTCGLRVSKNERGTRFVEHMELCRKRGGAIDDMIVNYAKQDGHETVVGIFQDPGGAGKRESEDMVAKLEGFEIHVEKASKDKITMAKPVSSQCEVGNYKIVRGPWNERFFNFIEEFPDGGHDDPVDALSLADIVLRQEQEEVVFV